MSKLLYKYEKYHKKMEDMQTHESIIAAMQDFSDEMARNSINPIFTFSTYCTSIFQNVYSNAVSRGFIVGNHTHDYFEINYVFSGKVYQYIEGEITVLTEGCFVVLYPGAVHSVYAEKGSNAINILIRDGFASQIEFDLARISSDNFMSLLKQKKSCLIFKPQKEDVLVEYFKKIGDFSYETFSPDSFNKYINETEMKLLAAKIAICEKEGSITKINYLTSEQTDKSKPILEYINSNYNSVTAETVAKKFNYSRRQLYRIIKKCTGESFSVHVSQIKFNNAAYMLSRTNMPVSEICRTVGLNPEYFYKFFKKNTNLTPAEYRQKYKDENIKIIGANTGDKAKK